MVTIGLNCKDCIQNLQNYVDRIDEIASLIHDGWVEKGKKEFAQSLLKQLKDSLYEDFKLRDKLDAQRKMTETERTCFLPAIHEAFTYIHVKTNSIPSRKWEDELYEARISIKYYLSDLESMGKETEKMNTTGSK